MVLGTLLDVLGALYELEERGAEYERVDEELAEGALRRLREGDDGADDPPVPVMVRLGGALRSGVRIVTDGVEGAAVRGALMSRERVLGVDIAVLRGDCVIDDAPGVTVRLGGALRSGVCDGRNESVMVRAREPASVERAPSRTGVLWAVGAPLRVVDSVSEPITRVRGDAGTGELVLGLVRKAPESLAPEGVRRLRDTAEGVSVPPASGAVRALWALRTVRWVPEPLGSTRLPPALLMIEDVVGLAERSTATLRRRAPRDVSVMGVRNIRPPVRSTEEKLVRAMLDWSSAVRVEAAMLRGPIVSGPRITRRGE